MNWVKNSQLQQCEKANPGFLEKSPTDSLDVCCLDQLFSSASNTNTNVSIQRMQNGISGSFFCLVNAICLILMFNFWQTCGSLQVTLVKCRNLGQTLCLGASVYFLKVNFYITVMCGFKMLHGKWLWWLENSVANKEYLSNII